jgi:hypothetical protein
MTDGAGRGAGAELVGSLGEEAARLLAAVQDWVRQTTASAPIATGAPECEWCPICQLIGLVRGDRGDLGALAEQAGELARVVVSTLVATLPAHHHGPAAAPADDPGGEAPGAAGGSARKVERINLFGGPIVDPADDFLADDFMPGDHR